MQSYEGVIEHGDFCLYIGKALHNFYTIRKLGMSIYSYTTYINAVDTFLSIYIYICSD